MDTNIDIKSLGVLLNWINGKIPVVTLELRYIRLYQS